MPAVVREDPQPGRWLPPAIVVGVIALIVGGGQALAGALTSSEGGVVRVGAVELQPRPGWEVVSATTDPDVARLHRGAVALDIIASGPDATGPASIVVRYVEERLRPILSQLSPAGPELVVLPNGAPAARVAYVGVTPDGLSIEGVVTAVAGSSASALFDAAAPRGELIAVADDLQAMIDGAVVP